MPTRAIRSSPSLANVRYEIRGRLARRAQEMERMGYEITSLNIGNPGAFGFRTPETMRLAMIENLRSAEGYCHQKGIFPAREAVVMQQQERGVRGVTADDVFIGNGVSELIDAIVAAGVPEVDAGSFVPPKVVPQFADADAVFAHALANKKSATIMALVPNVKGAERAIAAGVDAMCFVISASETHNRANVRRTIDEQLDGFRTLRATR